MKNVRYEGIGGVAKLKKKILIVLGIVLIGIIIGAFFIFSGTTNPLAVDSELKNDAERYFLSEVELTENRYDPTLVKCLVDEQGNEIYQQWSVLYDSSSPYKVALVRVEFKEKFFMNKSCFIKEIKTEKDWQEVKGEYNFSKEKFGR